MYKMKRDTPKVSSEMVSLNVAQDVWTHKTIPGKLINFILSRDKGWVGTESVFM